MVYDTRSLELHFKDLNGHDNAVIIDKWPDMCPICEHGIEAIFIEAHGRVRRYHGDVHYVQAIFKCPREECQTIFITYYTSASGVGMAGSESYVFLRNTFVRAFFKTEEFDQEIEILSPGFTKIYTQAKIADDMELHLICGAGYRKALEFLIKDYLIYKKPSKKKEIVDSSLGKLIVDEVDSEKVKKSAGLAKDVGNDETHYQRKLEELTVEDLKKLIKISTHWISDELAMEGYLDKISKKQKVT